MKARKLTLKHRIFLVTTVVIACSCLVPCLLVFLVHGLGSDEALSMLGLMALGSGAGAVLAFVAAKLGLYDHLLAPLLRLKSWLEAHAEGRPVEEDFGERADELGEMAEDIRDLVQKLSHEASHSTKLVDDIRETIKKISNLASSIYGISNDQAAGANEQASAVQESSTTSKEIAVTAKEITSTALSVLEMAEKGSKACNQGMTSVKRAVDGMKDLQKQVQSIATRMVELGENSQKIGYVLQIIVEISERTNLLALNANIEAASAGEAGKRFGVVASEIRELATKTRDSTKDIKDLIDKIQTSTNNTIMVTEQGLKAVGDTFDLVNMVGDSFDNIEEQVNETIRAAKEITFSTQQQTSACEQMAMTIGEVSQVAERFARSAEETTSAVAELNELTDVLKARVKENGNE